MSNTCAVRLDRSNTSIAFAVRWWGAFTVRGHFERCHGELHVPNGDLSSASILLDAEAASIVTGIALRDHHLRGPQFLDAARYPVISFRSTQVLQIDGAIHVAGSYVLRGVERTIVARSPLGWVDGVGLGSTVVLGSSIQVLRLDHAVGAASGLRVLNPLLHAIGRQVEVSVRIVVPASRLLPALLPALGH